MYVNSLSMAEQGPTPQHQISSLKHCPSLQISRVTLKRGKKNSFIFCSNSNNTWKRQYRAMSRTLNTKVNQDIYQHYIYQYLSSTEWTHFTKLSQNISDNISLSCTDKNSIKLAFPRARIWHIKAYFGISLVLSELCITWDVTRFMPRFLTLS